MLICNPIDAYLSPSCVLFHMHSVQYHPMHSSMMWTAQEKLSISVIKCMAVVTQTTAMVYLPNKATA